MPNVPPYRTPPCAALDPTIAAERHSIIKGGLIAKRGLNLVLELDSITERSWTTRDEERVLNLVVAIDAEGLDRVSDAFEARPRKLPEHLTPVGPYLATRSESSSSESGVTNPEVFPLAPAPQNDRSTRVTSIPRVTSSGRRSGRPSRRQPPRPRWPRRRRAARAAPFDPSGANKPTSSRTTSSARLVPSLIRQPSSFPSCGRLERSLSRC